MKRLLLALGLLVTSLSSFGADMSNGADSYSSNTVAEPVPSTSNTACGSQAR